MKPARFKYTIPETIEEALMVLGQYGDEAQILAGGQSLIPLMNLRLAQPSVLVDISRVAGVTGISGRSNGELDIGATTTQLAVARSDALREHFPVIEEALKFVGYPAIQARGTFGGSVAHADPAAELPAVIVALEGEMHARGRGQERTIVAQEFFCGTFTTALEPGEILTKIHIPALAAGTGWSFQEVSRRRGDFALVGVAALARTGQDGALTGARVVLSGVADAPVRATSCEQFLEGKTIDSELLREASEIATKDLDPPDDVHASGRYRISTAKILIDRAVRKAAGRAKELRDGN